MDVDELRHRLCELAREHILPSQIAIVVVSDATRASYACENFDPALLPAALREMADKIEREPGAQPLHIFTARGRKPRD